MGYHAESKWDITFKSQDDKDECERALLATDSAGSWTDMEPGLLAFFGEEADEYPGAGALEVKGWTSGDFYGTPEHDSIINAHATGTVVLQDTGADTTFQVVYDGEGGPPKVYMGITVFPQSPATRAAVAQALRDHGALTTGELVDAVLAAIS